MRKAMVLAAAVVLVGSASAFAGADATFAPLVLQVTNWLQGSLGTLMALFAALMGVGSAIRGLLRPSAAFRRVTLGAFDPAAARVPRSFSPAPRLRRSTLPYPPADLGSPAYSRVSR